MKRPANLVADVCDAGLVALQGRVRCRRSRIRFRGHVLCAARNTCASCNRYALKIDEYKYKYKIYL
jgi:hypothetical protein